MISLVGRARERRLLSWGVAGAIAAAATLGWLVVRSKGETRPAAPRGAARFDVGLEDGRKVAGFVEAYGRRIDGAERRLAEREGELATLADRVKRLDGVLAALVRELETVHRDDPATVGRGASGVPTPEPAAPPARLSRVRLPVAGDEAGKPVRATVLPAGSFAEATLLTGVYAPIEGGALPIQLRLDAALVGPNRARVPLAGAFLIGKAEGDVNSTRVLVQLEKLSMVTPDGRSVDVPVNGYVTDADGVQGIAGSYVWRLAEAATVASAAGGLSAAADALAARETLRGATPLGGATETVTGDPVRFAMGRGASRAAETIERIVAKRLDQVVPAVYVPNGRRLTVVLLDSVSLGELEKAGSSRSPYDGLDARR